MTRSSLESLTDSRPPRRPKEGFFGAGRGDVTGIVLISGATITGGDGVSGSPGAFTCGGGGGAFAVSGRDALPFGIYTRSETVRCEPEDDLLPPFIGRSTPAAIMRRVMPLLPWLRFAPGRAANATFLPLALPP